MKLLLFLQDINKRLQAYKASEQMQLFTKQEIIEEIKELYTVRYNRIKMSYFSLNIQYWIVVCIMTAINLIFVCMLGTKLYLHKISVGLVCITSSSMLFLYLSLINLSVVLLPLINMTLLRLYIILRD